MIPSRLGACGDKIEAYNFGEQNHAIYYISVTRQDGLIYIRWDFSVRSLSFSRM